MLALSDLQDAYGHAMLDFYFGQGGVEHSFPGEDGNMPLFSGKHRRRAGFE
jgi:hypothetical protein